MHTMQRWTIAGIFFAALSTTPLYAQEPQPPTDTEPMWRVYAVNGLVYVRKSDEKKDKHTWIADKNGDTPNAVLGSPQETREDISRVLGSYTLGDFTASELFGSNGKEPKTFKFPDDVPGVDAPSSPPGGDYRTDFSIVAIPVDTLETQGAVTAEWNSNLWEHGVESTCCLKFAQTPMGVDNVDGNPADRTNLNSSELSFEPADLSECQVCNDPDSTQEDDVGSLLQANQRGGAPRLTLPLGFTGVGDSSAGSLVYSFGPETNLGDPSAWMYSMSDRSDPEATLEVLRAADNTLLQIATSLRLIDIVVISETAGVVTEYTINYYERADFSTDKDAIRDGVPVYSPLGSPMPTASLTMQSSADRKNLSFTNVFEGISKTIGYDFTTMDGLAGWLMTTTRSGKQRREFRYETPANTSQGTECVTQGVKIWEIDTLLQHEIETYCNFNADDPNQDHWRRVKWEQDPDGANHVTLWEYYNDPAQSIYRLLKSQQNPTGSWSTWDYDSEKRLIKRVESFKDSAFASADAQNRVFSHDYTPLDPLDDGSRLNGTARTITERLLETVVGTTFRVFAEFTEIEEIATVAGAAYGDPSNLRTVTKFYDTGPFQGRIQSILRPDGTLQTFEYSYSGNNEIESVATGAANAAKDAVIAGTRRVTTTQRFTGSVLSNSEFDIESNLQLSLTEFSNFDADNRPQTQTFIDGSKVEQTYGCCGIASETDRDGITTIFTYDDEERLIARSRAGLTTLLEYDVLDRQVKTIRKGSDNSEIVLEQVVYDTLGRVVAQTTPLGTINTIYSVGDGGKTVITTLADGGVKVEESYNDGQTRQIVGDAVRPVAFDYGVANNRQFTQQFAGDFNSLEWTKTFTDLAGRRIKTEFAGGAGSEMVYNQLGQLEQSTDPDGVITLFAYNSEGEQIQTVIDINQNQSIDLAGSDRITETETEVATRSLDGGGDETVRRTLNKVYDAGSSVPRVIAISETDVDGLDSWEESFGLLTVSQTVRDGSGGRINTVTAPDGSTTVTETRNSLIQTVTQRDASGVQLSQISTSYDAHNRVASQTEFGVSTTTFTYYDSDLVATQTEADGTAIAQTTQFIYDPVGRLLITNLPDGSAVHNEYFPTGDLQKTFGSQTYTTEFTYDEQGRQKTLTTFRDGVTPDTTTWNYDPQRGFLIDKTYADGLGTQWTYTPAGRLQSRVWQRGITTSYGYNTAGELTSTTYSDGTPPISIGYDRLGRQASISDDSGTRLFAYTEFSGIEEMEISGGSHSDIILERQYDDLNRLEQQRVYHRALGDIQSVNFSYDDASRLATVSDGSHSARYHYHPDNGLVQTLSYNSGSDNVLSLNTSFDALKRITGKTNQVGNNTISSYLYTYNDLNQRTQIDRDDGRFWEYDYNDHGEVIAGKHKVSVNEFVPGEQFEYEFDGIGNRQAVRQGGDAQGNQLEESVYSANNLNQYTQRSLVGINSDPSNPAMTSAADLPSIDQAGQMASGITTGRPRPTDIVNMPINPSQNLETFIHDQDGNLMRDGRYDYSWNGENRLIALQSLQTVPDNDKQRIEYAYDADGRRIRKRVLAFNTATNTYDIPISERRFVYATGFNLIAETEADFTNPTSYIWGLDLSQTTEDAGGVGGLLWQNDGANIHYTAYDANGNVSNLVDSTGSVTATYDYSPFGKVVSQSGAYADINKFRFSTKYLELETDYYYYGFRYYDPDTGRWLNRDPSEERGGINLYAYLMNSPVNFVDFLGLKFIRVNFGFDLSAKADAKTIRLIQQQIDAAETILLKCITLKCCSKPRIDLKASYDWNREDKRKPSDGDYDLDDTADSNLKNTNIRNINTGEAGPKVLITESTIHSTFRGRRVKAQGAAANGNVILNIVGAQLSALAHELGHVARYDGGDIDGKVHHSDDDNVMSRDGGMTPDCNYCKKMEAIAQ